MKKTLLLLSLIATSLLGTAATAAADNLRESYVAFLSSRDHFNSNGERLTNAAAIIRQDRANYHKFGKRDKGDEGDRFFASAQNREILERYLKRGTSTPGALSAIVNGTPVVLVKIYQTDSGDDYINVTIVE